MNVDQTRAEDLFIYYMSLLLRKAGVEVDSDIHAELRNVIACTIAAAVEESKK